MESVYMKMVDALDLNGTNERAILADATPGERIVYVLRGVDDEIANGGYYQLFWNDTGSFTTQAESEARAIDATHWADLLASAADRAFSGHGVPSTRSARQKAIGCPGYCAKDRFTDLENRWRDGEIDDRLRVYIRSHPRQFFASEG